MKRFVYVAAYATPENVRDSPKLHVVPESEEAQLFHDFLYSPAGLISFQHVLIEAEDESDAYLKGGREMAKASEPPGTFINDYVVLVPEIWPEE